jgi:murein DD-endopeptidase MepM/ murein hydrolase activator NlpD
MSILKLKHIKPLGSEKYEKNTGLLYRSEGRPNIPPNLVGRSEAPLDKSKSGNYSLPSNDMEARKQKYMYGKTGNTTTSDDEPNVKDKEVFSFGETKLTITDPFYVRQGFGRKGKHSTGVDYKTDNNQAIALTDMEIVSVKIDGSGRSYHPEDKGADGKQLPASGGYYIVTKNSDGTMSQYMHLNPMTKVEMERLEGKKFKKGENIWGYDIGSGSMTGKHVKVRFANGMPSSKNYINPSKYFLGV